MLQSCDPRAIIPHGYYQFEQLR